jgi:hypothetical protein
MNRLGVMLLVWMADMDFAAVKKVFERISNA